MQKEESQLAKHLSDIEEAVAECLKEEHDLFDIDVNERSITHKLAEYIQSKFLDYDVDCEYNRLGHDPKSFKTLKIPSHKETASTADTKGTTVFPDIIIHHRLNNDDNLAVIEVKKSDGAQDDIEFDRKKLSAYVSELHYKVGLQLIVEVEGSKKLKNGYSLEQITKS